MSEQQLIPNLFRTEFRKMCSVLCKTFGIQNIEFAEDIVSDTFLEASEGWGIKGIPTNPRAWLYATAKNKAIDSFRRNKLFREKIQPNLIAESNDVEELTIDFQEENIQDAQLKMMFALSHPSIPKESQIGLSLRILCGFGIDEIASAFLSSKETINKRLFRAKEKLRLAEIKMELPDKSQLNERMDAVHRTLYLLFNEGYYSVSSNDKIKKNLCLEAMRLTKLLLDADQVKQSETKALLALMCFHASRIEARISDQGDIILYEDQDESKWNQALIDQGKIYIHASSGQQPSKYHLEASIAHWHTSKEDSTEKWENILQLYNALLQIEYSLMAALNRTYALYKSGAEEMAIQEAEKINLEKNHLFHGLLGKMYSKTNKQKAIEHYQLALGLCPSTLERDSIQKIIAQL